MSQRKVEGINAPLIVLGIILMLIGLVLLGLAFDTMASVIYWGMTLGSGGIFSSADGALEFSLFAFIMFLIGLVITEKQIVENQKSKSS
jgi:hypothetical protein